MVGLLLVSCSSQGESAVYLPIVTEDVQDGQYAGQITVPAGFSPADSTYQDPMHCGHFLPLPGNLIKLGPVSRGQADFSRGVGILLSTPLSTGSVVVVKPIAVLQLNSGNGNSEVMICVPADSGLETIPIADFTDLLTDYDSVRLILQTWFLNCRRDDAYRLIGWKDAAYAKQVLSNAH